MYILKTLKPISMNGETVQPGQVVKVPNDQGLINKGYARKLSQDETRAILDGYVREAQRLFSEEPETKTIPMGKKNFVQEQLL
jgi:hypothetical protein